MRFTFMYTQVLHVPTSDMSPHITAVSTASEHVVYRNINGE